jgi:glycosyltransferase involved in cell wall biosynthesis
MDPLVSIVIPTKNRRDLLRETIASVASQTYSHWEVIVVDDGSNDHTGEMIQSITSTDQRVRFVRRERSPAGASTCRNLGVSAAGGEYVVFLDSDDLLAPMCLERRVQFMEQNPNIDFAVFLMRIFHLAPGDSPYLRNNFTTGDDLDRFLRFDPPWHTCGPLWRKTSLARIGLWDERALCAQDWEFHIRAISAGLNYLKVPEVDSFWRATRAGSISNSWRIRRYVCNRVRLFKRVIAVLRSQGLLTNQRRRCLAGVYYEHAFDFALGRDLTFKIWMAGWRGRIVGNFEFIITLSGEAVVWMVRRSNRFVLHRLFPERQFVRKRQIARTHLKVMAPISNLDQPVPAYDSTVKPYSGNHSYES